MRISHVTIELTTDDLNELLQEFPGDVKARITAITPNGLQGQIRILLWNVDFVARPAVEEHSLVSLEISAHKLIPIPTAVVQRQLKEAIKDAPPGVDVFRQALRVHLPSLLSSLGISLEVRELRTEDGKVRVTIEGIQMPNLRELFGKAAQALDKV